MHDNLSYRAGDLVFMEKEDNVIQLFDDDKTAYIRDMKLDSELKKIFASGKYLFAYVDESGSPNFRIGVKTNSAEAVYLAKTIELTVNDIISNRND